MPELPEVETIRLQLNDYIVGKTISSIEVVDSKLASFLSAHLMQCVRGKKITGLTRAAKALCIEVEKEYCLAVHLKMTGRLIYRDEEINKKLSKTKLDLDIKTIPNKDTRAIINFTDKSVLYFQDARRFGWVKIVLKNDFLKESFANGLGPEPFDKECTAEYLLQQFKKTRRPIKVVLLDQTVIGGVGNIYANEALFMSLIHPERPANSLHIGEVEKLRSALIEILKKGIQYGGASDMNFRNALGLLGRYQEHYLVYNCANKPCKNCGTKIVKRMVGGRGTFFCENCQKQQHTLF